jgi:uncharacterized protein YfbU (UPF0304 family)
MRSIFGRLDSIPSIRTDKGVTVEIVTVRLRPETKTALEGVARSRGERPTETMRRILEEASGTSTDTAWQPRSFTEVQRMTLIRQLDILTLLDPDRRDDYARDRAILAHGYTGRYASVHPHLDEELSRDDCRLVEQLIEDIDVLDRSVEALPADSQTRHLVSPVIRDDLYRGFSRVEGVAGGRMAEYARFLVDGREDLPEQLRDSFTTVGNDRDLPAQSPRYRELERLVAHYQTRDSLPGGLLGEASLIQICLHLVPDLMGTETSRAAFGARSHLSEMAQLPDDDLRDTVLDVLEESFADRVYDEVSGDSHEVVRSAPDAWFWGLIDAVIADHSTTAADGEVR